MVGVARADQVLSWGRCHRFDHVRLVPGSLAEARAVVASRPGPLLGYGLGRSYGDSCLNDQGVLIDTRRLDRFIRFDEAKGELVCEAGVSIAAILDLLARRPCPGGGYWMLPVVPGTKFVTVGGAIANDVHGKNHEDEGTFGCHVGWLELARSDGSLVRCSLDDDAELFRATIGGIGLTGLVTRASLSLMRVPGLSVEVEHVRLDSLDDYYRAAEESRADWTHHAAWIDVLAAGSRAGRGIYTRSRFIGGPAATAPPASVPKRRMPVDAPSWLIAPSTIRLFNSVYRRKLMSGGRRTVSSYDPVLFPLDGIAEWNRMYGRRGFYQYQCVVPAGEARPAIRALLAEIARDGHGSFLSVLKEFGGRPSPGLMSFPLAGTTRAVDFPNGGEPVRALLDRLDAITAAAAGRVYLAKDGRASPEMLRRGYPELERFRRSIDPAFTSSLWRRSAGAR